MVRRKHMSMRQRLELLKELQAAMIESPDQAGKFRYKEEFSDQHFATKYNVSKATICGFRSAHVGSLDGQFGMSGAMRALEARVTDLEKRLDALDIGSAWADHPKLRAGAQTPFRTRTE